MSENERLIQASVEDVFAVLTDGWSYASWVVGASRIRDVAAGWPQPGHSIHHSVRVWPLLIDDASTVEQYEPQRLLRLKVRAPGRPVKGLSIRGERPRRPVPPDHA